MSNSSNYICPACGAPILLENVNIAQDIALCRACGQSHRFSQLVNQKENDSILSTQPNRLSVEKTHQGMTITYKRFHWSGLLLGIIALVWNGFIWKAFLSDTKESPLFFVPFLIMGVLLLGTAVFCLFGKQVITTEPGKGSYFVGIGRLGITRHFSLLPQTTLTQATTTSYSRNPFSKVVSVNQTTYKLVINTPPEKSISIGGFLDQEVVPYLKAVLSQLKN